MKKIGILGTTGSIGKSAISILKEQKENFQIEFAHTHSNYEELFKIALEMNIKILVISNEKLKNKICDIPKEIKVFFGEKSLLSLIESSNCDIILNGISGSAGLIYSIKIIENKIDLANRSNDLKKLANEVVSRVKGKYIRGLFSGGTLCDETQLLFRQFGLGDCYGNAPLNEAYTLEDVWKSKENTIIDMGEDEFTVGRPHPMIDYSLRTKKIVEEAKDSDVAIILMDVVLGYGSNMDPSGELVAPIKEAKKIAPNTEIICSICGTDKDPQNRTEVKKALSGAGALVIDSNAAASELCVNILKQLGGK